MKQVLIIQTAFIGDAILSTALAESIHASFPDAYIDILVKNDQLTLFDNHPYINNVFLFNRGFGKLKELRRLLKLIRSKKYDAVINCHRFFSSGFLTAFSGATVRSGFSKNPLSLFFTHKSTHSLNHIHEIDRNIQLVDFAGIKKSLMPKLYISDDIDMSVAEYKEKKYVCIAPASVWFTKQFPVEKWIEFLNTIPSSITVYLLGAENDRDLCQLILKGSGVKNTVNLSGKLNLLQTASLMKDATMNYVNDSAPLHITSAVDAPVTALFCSTVPSFGFGPLSSDNHIVQVETDLACRPCGIHGKKTCPEKHFRCAMDIDIHTMTNILLEKLKENHNG